jgi:hypothetical protein
MSRMRISGWCVLVVFALGAIGAGTAAALPEVGRCVAKPGTGKYKEANCVEKAGAKLEEKAFEFVKGGEKLGFTATDGVTTWETEAGSLFTCKSTSASGKFDEDSGVIKEVEDVVLVYKGCFMGGFLGSCKTVGAEEEEIKTEKLKGALGYISGEKTKTPVVGQELTPETAKGNFAAYECGGGAAKFIVKGSLKEVEAHKGGECVIAPLSEVNVMSATVGQTYSGSGGKQTPQHFQLATSKYCNLEVNSNGGPFELTTFDLVNNITYEEALEVKA